MDYKKEVDTDQCWKKYRIQMGLKLHAVNRPHEFEKIWHLHPDSKFLVKIDTKGSEFMIFESFEKNDCFEHIDVILMEYHRDYEPLVEILRKYKYRFMIQGTQEFGIIYAFK